MDPITITITTALGGSLIYIVKKQIGNNIMYGFKYLNIKRKMKKAIKTLDYEEFKNIIYEVKVMDNKYEKTGYLKLKQSFFFGDNVLEEKEIFLMKYDPNYDYETVINGIGNNIKELIEMSVSRMNSPDHITPPIEEY